MLNQIQSLDVAALTQDIPTRSLKRGQVGTVVELLDKEVFKVEFSDNEGCPYAELSMCADQLIVLHYEPA